MSIHTVTERQLSQWASREYNSRRRCRRGSPEGRRVSATHYTTERSGEAAAAAAAAAAATESGNWERQQRPKQAASCRQGGRAA